MPALELFNNKLDHWTTYSTMVFPSDEYMRDRCYMMYLTMEALSAAEEQGIRSIEFSPQEIQELLDSPSKIEIENAIFNEVISGYIAGSLLLYIYFMSESNVEEPSLRKAIYICSQEYQYYINDKGKRFPSSEPSIRKCWNTHQNVSHFWGAVVLLGQNRQINTYIIKDFVFGKKFNSVLSIAAKLQDFGEHFISTRNKDAQALLDSTNIWRIPNNIKLSDIDFNVDSLPDHMQDALERYPKRYTY